MRWSVISVSCLLSGCKGPVEAPGTLDELCGYIYSHHADEDPAAMEAGLAELYDWLQENWEQTQDDEGYEINPISDEVADSLDGRDRSVEGLIGLAVATDSVHSVDAATHAMVVAELVEVYPDMFESHQRVIPEGYDVGAFVAREDQRLEIEELMESEFYGLVTAESHAWNQYVWVETALGPAMVQRNWNVDPPDVEGLFSGALEVEEQYYLNLFMPSPGGFLRLQATWMVLGDSSLADDYAKNLTVGNMRENSEALDLYLSSGS